METKNITLSMQCSFVGVTYLNQDQQVEDLTQKYNGNSSRKIMTKLEKLLYFLTALKQCTTETFFKCSEL